MERVIRVLLSRDDFYHQRGYWVIAQTLREEGMEVIPGDIQIPREIVETALQEDVDIIGYRIMQASPKVVVPRLFEYLEESCINNTPVVIGGIVPKKDIPMLMKLGVKDIFHPLTSLGFIVKRIKDIYIESASERDY